MNSVATSRFWRCYEALPAEIQQRADTAYQLWRVEPHHRSLAFKQVHATRPIFSVRIGRQWRALAVQDGDTMVWFWIGSHADYDSLLTRF